MKALYCFAFVSLAMVVSDTVASPPTSWDAAIVDSDSVLQSYGFPSKTVQVTFPKSFPTNVASAVRNYQVFQSDTPSKTIEIQSISLGGNLHEDEKGRPSRASRVFLLPRGEVEAPKPNTTYMVRVTFGNESSGDIPARWPTAAETPAQPSPSDNEVINIISVASNLFFAPLNIKVDARSPLNGNHIPGIDVSVNYDVAQRPILDGSKTNFSSMWIVSGNLEAEGTFKLDSSQTNIADHVFVSGNVQLLRLYRLGDPLTAIDPVTRERQGKLAYYVGFRLKALQLEADQSFDVVNLSVQPQLALWVPYSNLPGIWWSRNIGISGNAATPLFIYAGYSYVNAVREDSSVVSSAIQKDDRFELEIAYALPITSKLRLGLRSRLFWLLDTGKQANYQELFARYYLDRNSTTALLFKYTRGEVPPKFEKGEAATAGFSMEF